MATEKVKKDWKKATEGIRYWEHPTRKHKGKADRYWMVYFRRDGQLKQVSVGWASKGANLGKAQTKLLKYSTNAKDGAGPTSDKEQRAIKEKENKAALVSQEQERLRLEHEERENVLF